MEILYSDPDLIVCVKPPRVLSTDEPGGLPDLVRQALGDPNADVRTVHRLDRVVSGLMVLARNRAAASFLSRQIREDRFGKTYLAVVHGIPGEEAAVLRDFLHRDKKERKSYVVPENTPESQEAVLDYVLLGKKNGLSKVKIHLHTGRTHQIRAQFSGRGYPLVGDRKYSVMEDSCEIALWSYEIQFTHPRTGKPKVFSMEPPDCYPWDLF